MILAVIRVPASVACSKLAIAVWSLSDHPSITSSLLETFLTPPPALSYCVTKGMAALLQSSVGVELKDAKRKLQYWLASYQLATNYQLTIATEATKLPACHYVIFCLTTHHCLNTGVITPSYFPRPVTGTSWLRNTWMIPVAYIHHHCEHLVACFRSLNKC